ncbi:fumarylacetoacetate hydrolase family protein [Spirosoma radiotolerans]|uniref:2-hydroxyhepta-2,4-diene-1,7-dioate isomerase n=1 Tax=Spirosoma radiotolerans TaxID=1379870 RepID=A0A0E3ZZU7_9BACT|nr:fumarylacetoacetate hydrolase family protein [Spirosoma radiotolerans]AKD58388.1 2-hydroxyhepta-2,4-diene-1,7-dioate isomerase [Spirosoma radiotolerans]
MNLYKTRSGIVVHFQDQFYSVPADDWDELINRDDLHEFLITLTAVATPSDAYQDWLKTGLLAPIGRQEVWASGVTYLRSRDARMEESKKSGGDNFYDRVYDAERPELFFKSTPERVVGPGAAVRIRADSTWNVPEPELTLFITSSGKIVGYTCGNDMSSRSIEGENPLYLPQAKSYDGSAALGPCLYVPEVPIASDTQIRLEIIRDEQAAFTNNIAINQMKRQHTELVSFLYRECSFSYGCFLMTGTGIVPPDDFTLRSGDVIRITIDGIGTLENTVA